MRLLSATEIDRLDSELAAAAGSCNLAQYSAWADSMGDSPALVEFPLGELTNGRIGGFVWVWGMKGIVQSARIDSGDRFNAQGLEGKCTIPVTLTTALLVYRELPPNRCQIRANLD